MSQHFWKGEWINDAGLEARLAGWGEQLARDLPGPLALETLLDACERMSERLEGEQSLRELVSATDLAELAAFLKREQLNEKIRRELAAGDARQLPFRLERTHSRDAIFEAWRPLGLLVHIAPTNAVNVPFLSVIEGLLAGNVNILKTGGQDSLYPQHCLELLVKCDSTGTLASYIYAARFSSKRQDLLKLILAQADGVAVWGNEEALEGIRALAPAHARLIGWGPKISLAYVEASQNGLAEVLRGIAREICFLEQQACSSPQVVYLDTTSPAELHDFARLLAAQLAEVSANFPRTEPSPAEQAEITQLRLLTLTERALTENRDSTVIESPAGDWRLLLDGKMGLRASPLYRTVWVKALPQSRIVETLRPLRHFLQTVGLACAPASLATLSELFFRAGALRINPVGQMVSGYLGEPHDGVYALQRYSRRVSVLRPKVPEGLWALDDLGAASREGPAPTGPVIGKAEVSRFTVAPEHAHLFFKSGGSSGEPVLSIFTYDDYHIQMRLAAQGLFAAGLDPRTDRCMNLFHAGGLYGGFLSFFTILEELQAVQYPMSGLPDLAMIGKVIFDQGVDTLLGMPSHLWGLFLANEELLLRYRREGRGIRKVFYGGEHFSAAQITTLHEKFGVALIKSAAYGSNDTGPMGYQCAHSQGGVHHLHSHLQQLEILDLEKDAPVAAGQVGRMILTSKVRQGQPLRRYAIGDLGRWIEDPCPCGRTSPRFELLGRYGDTFKMGGMIFNGRKFGSILSGLESFAGEYQLIVSDQERLTLRYSGESGLSEEAVREACLRDYRELREVVEEERVAYFEVRAVPTPGLERTAASGKLKLVIDQRVRA